MEEDFFNNLDEETKAKIQEAQIIEGSFQQLLQQKQMFSMELNETDFALKELEKSDGEVFKIVGGQIILKTSKESLTADLKNKQELIQKRLKSIDKQEQDFSEKLDVLREEIMGKISEKK
jgi:prefoldin beta subunit